MLGGLSRWLRAAGYDAAFEYGIEDGALVSSAMSQDRILLSSDGGLFERNLVRSGAVRTLYVPRAMPPVEQLGFVLRTLGLSVRSPKCMACGGDLVEVAKRAISADAPPRSFAAYDRFWRCGRCLKLYWRGTHWTRIARALSSVAVP
jgi:uncharacterized protein with PIN domain